MNLTLLNSQLSNLLVKIGQGETIMDAVRDELYSPENVKDSGVTVRTGVRNGQALIIDDSKPNAESFGFMDLSNGSCKPDSCEVDGSIRAPKWELGLLGCDTTLCLLKLPNLVFEFFAEEKWTDAELKNGVLQSRILAYIQYKFIENQKLADKRAVYFSDKDSDSKYLNGIDGVFKLLSAEDNHIAISQNDEDTNEEQTMTFDEVAAVLDEQFNKLQEQPKFNADEYTFRLTNRMAMPYLRGLQALKRAGEQLPDGCCVDASAYTGGVIRKEDLAFNGIPIKIDYDWDFLIENLPALNGGSLNNARVHPNISLLARDKDIYLGTTRENRIGSNTVIIDHVNNVLIMRGLSYVGALIPFPERVSLAI